jgi:hypothetical protein
MIDASVILATRNENQCPGLITFSVSVPYYIWVELLTHKRLSRNASSARAQSTARHAGMGHYTPDVFYKQGEFMESSDEPIEDQGRARDLWQRAWDYGQNAAVLLSSLGVAKEQTNRVIPAFKLVNGVMTGTESAWRAFLQLRKRQEKSDSQPDKAMQEFSAKIEALIPSIEWRDSDFHVPMLLDDEKPTYENLLIAGARLARVSVSRPKVGQNDLELANRLLKNKHLSPFEHIAHWGFWPIVSAICCKPSPLMGSDQFYDPVTDDDDVTRSWQGWDQFRARLEKGESFWWD